MSKVAKAVRGFLKSMDWRWQERTPTRYEVIVPGAAGQWLWLAQWEEDDSFFAGHSIIPVSVPARRRPAAAEYLTRANYNMRVGNFEMDYADGQVCFRTSMFLCGLRPTAELIRRTAFANFSSMDRYLPGLLAVIYGKATPKAAIRKAERPREAKASKDDDAGDDQGGQDDQEDRTRADSRVGKCIAIIGGVKPVVARPRKLLVSRERRTAQFERYLKLMEGRAHGEGQPSCFMSFARPLDSRIPGPRGDRPQNPPMVQFCFKKKWFAIDVPNTNICPADAVRVVQERRGFYREAERPDAGVTTDVSDLVTFDPIGKKYIYGDEREAAEDAAYLFYDVWGLRPDAELMVKASSFDGPSWEKDVPLE
jgi:hypothetical protein